MKSNFFLACIIVSVDAAFKDFYKKAASFGYFVEEHIVGTLDGYLLSIIKMTGKH